jgi:hypothetical protein
VSKLRGRERGRSTFNRRGAGAFLCIALFSAIAAQAQDGCNDFKWDVSKERALFAGTPTAMVAGTDVKSAPVVVPNQLYRLALAPQSGVNFSVRQGKNAVGDAHAGLAILRINAEGIYRVAVDLPVWIDVVATDSVLRPTDFQGQHGCTAPRKIVEFELTSTKPLLLQFSDATVDQLLVSVTPAPVRLR